MGRGKRDIMGRHGDDARDWHGTGGSGDRRWDRKNPEDDPFRDLRPRNEELADPANDEYLWPDMSDENDEDD